MLRARRSDRGVVLVIALLLMLALAGIGIAAIRSASNELNISGNARISQVARNIASAGAESAMAFAGSRPSAFLQYATARGVRIPMENLSANFYDTAVDGTGSFGRDGATMDNARWEGRLADDPVATHRAPGFQVGEFCFRRYIVETDGTYMSGTTASSLTIDRNAQARSMAVMYVGPVTCP